MTLGICFYSQRHSELNVLLSHAKSFSRQLHTLGIEFDAHELSSMS